MKGKMKSKWIRFFWIPLIRIRKIGNASYEVWLLFLPLLTVRKVNNKILVNILVIQKIYDHTVTPFRLSLVRAKNKNKKQSVFKKFASGEKLKLVLIACRPGAFCFNYLYPVFNNDTRFDVRIIVMPDHRYSSKELIEYMEKTLEELRGRGYPAIPGYDAVSDKILNLRTEIGADIIFYTDFWKPHFFDEYYITSFLDKITILNEYGYSVRQDEQTCNFELNNLVDIYFRPTDIHLKMAKELMDNGGRNVLPIGSPKLDERFDAGYRPHDVWKQQDKIKKRIIWAPHYNNKTAAQFYQNDAFFYIYDYMLEIAEKYKDTIQIGFRPHPVLSFILNQKWDFAATEAYYKKWAELENGQILEGGFVDSFMTSDAMIMDSCSFLAEYTAFDKPLFYTKTKTSRENFNEFGEMIAEHIYFPQDDLCKEIENFIQEVVISGNDYKADGRHKFVEEYFGKINGHTASENIYNEIIKFLEKGEITK